MKKYASKILAGAIALTMILGNFTGMGASEVKAASDTLYVQVLDEDDKAIEGLLLVLENSEGEAYEFDSVTDKNGKTSYEMTGEEMFEYYINPEEGSGYECEAPIEVYFGQKGIEKVNKYDYSGAVTQVFVKRTGGSQPAKAHIDKVTSSITEASWKGDTATITVTGTSLPEKLCYQVWYKEKNNAENEVGTIKSVQTTGSSTERKFNVAIPAVSAYPKSIQWIVKVIELETPSLSDPWSRVNIDIKKDTVTAETKAALQSAINEMNSLPESDYTAKSWGSYKAAIDAAKPLLTKQDATNTECQAAIQAIGKAKSALILKKDLAAESTKDVLRDAVNGTEGYRRSDYTAASWKAFSAAIAKAKSLLGNTDATETQCQEAIREIERTKAALVTAKVNVSKITVSGMSKSIAVGKTIQLTAKISPADATNKTVKWTSSNKKYAAVDSKGKVSAKKVGAGKTVTITAAAADGSGKKATYKIKIMKNSVKSIKLKAAKSVKAGKSIKVKATVKTTGKKANKALKWTSSNRQYAAVTAKGVVKTKKAGKGKKVKITAMATDGSNKKKTVTIKIK